MQSCLEEEAGASMPGEVPDLPTEAARFLERDFNQCFEQMRHYDTLMADLVKFVFTVYTALVGVAIGLYEFSKSKNLDLLPAVAAILAVGYLVGLAIFLLLIRYRVYYVVVARYINWHRRFFLNEKPLGFQNLTGMYTNPILPPYFNWRSSYAAYLYLVSILNSILLAGLVRTAFPWWVSLTAGSVSLATHVTGAMLYLISRESQSADSAVFGAD
jgi:hypothetical protein